MPQVRLLLKGCCFKTILAQVHLAVNCVEDLAYTDSLEFGLAELARLGHHGSFESGACDKDCRTFKISRTARADSSNFSMNSGLLLRKRNMIGVIAITVNTDTKRSPALDDDRGVLLSARRGLSKIKRLL